MTPQKRYVIVDVSCWLCEPRKTPHPNCYYCKGAGKYQRKEKTFLCIGGPKNGRYLSESTVSDDYLQFNNASSDHNAHKCVFIWRGHFEKVGI